jgi:hypothetical protein
MAVNHRSTKNLAYIHAKNQLMSEQRNKKKLRIGETSASEDYQLPAIVNNQQHR